VHAHDADDFTDDGNTLPLLHMGSYIEFTRAEIAAYYTSRVPKLKLRASGESRGPCPIHRGKDDNFVVDAETGKWFCHSQCQDGGDILDLEMALTGREFRACKEEVFRIVGRQNGSAGDKGRQQGSKGDSQPSAAGDSDHAGSQPTPLLPATEVREGLAKAGYLASAEFQYGPSLRKVRFDHQSEKQGDKDRAKKTFRWEHSVNGIWYSGDAGSPKPLYINRLFRDQDQVQLAVGFEGEAKADLAGELGLSGFSFKNITPEQARSLVGCDVVLWPDNDRSGAEQAKTAADAIAAAGEVRSIRLVTPPPELPSAGDIVDLVHGLCWDRARVSQLIRTASDYQPAPPPDLPEPGGRAESQEGDGLTQSQILVELARVATLFHTPEGDDYACLPVRGHRELWSLKSKSCRRWFTRAFYERVGKPPSSQAMQDALGVLEARAQYDSAETQVFTRVAACGDSIYIDLCNDAWEAVEISGKGWRVVQDAPVRFRRSKAMQALPNPVSGLPISRLRNLINVGDDKNWILLLSWLVAACRPQGPYPVLTLQGEQGSAKSTTARLLRKIIDPVTAPLRTPPREERDLLIAANNSWIVAYDNISDIPQWLSDALCRLATGGGFSTRELYTDTDEVILDLTRPVILNGIDHLAERPDLADRSIILNLPRIDETARREEAELHAAYELERPYVLGALFTAVSVALARLPDVKLPRKPRMADFALWAAAAASALGFESDEFVNAYSGNRADAVQETLDSDPVSAAIVMLINEKQGEWEGTARDLLADLERCVDDRVKKSAPWPKTPRGISGRLRRLITFLREAGIEVAFGPKGSAGRRPLSIRRTVVNLTATTATTADAEGETSFSQSFGGDSASGGRGR
jgi:hypothetical protein